MTKHIVALVICIGVAGGVILAQSEEPLWPGAKYDPAIPTLKQVVGHDPGKEITSPDQVGQYLQALAKAVPARTRLTEYAKTWEGRLCG